MFKNLKLARPPPLGPGPSSRRLVVASDARLVPAAAAESGGCSAAPMLPGLAATPSLVPAPFQPRSLWTRRPPTLGFPAAGSSGGGGGFGAAHPPHPTLLQLW